MDPVVLLALRSASAQRFCSTGSRRLSVASIDSPGSMQRSTRACERPLNAGRGSLPASDPLIRVAE